MRLILTVTTGLILANSVKAQEQEIDPQASAQNNNFGAGNIPSAQDYLDLRAAQQSFSRIAAYLKAHIFAREVMIGPSPALI